MQPLKQCVYHRAGLFLAFLMAFFRCFVSNQFLDFVQDPDPCHCVVCNSLFQLLLGEVLFQCRKCGIKTASRVGKAAGHGNGIVQPVVCLVAIAGQVFMETSVKKLYRMISGAGSLIIEERHTRGAAIFIRKIYPHPVLGGTLLIRLADHLYPGLVTVDVPAFQEFLFHPVIQQFQVTVRTADDPVCHGFSGKVQVVSGEFPFLPRQRHSVDILGILLLVVDAQNGIVDERLYEFRKFVGNIKKLIGAAREQGIEVIYVQHDDGPDTGFSIGDDEFEVYSEFQPMPDEKRFIKSVCSAFKKESGLLEYLTAKEEKDVMICGIMTDFCINATVEAGFEHGLHMIVPAYANSTQDNEYMTREQAYHYYNEFLWPERYADCIPMDRALELLKK